MLFIYNWGRVNVEAVNVKVGAGSLCPSEGVSRKGHQGAGAQ